MIKRKLLLALGLVACIAMCGCGMGKTEDVSSATNNSGSEQKNNGSDIKNQNGGGRGQGMSQENDTETQAVIDENYSMFQQFTFKDDETGTTLEYNLYVPENYDESKSYPFIMYIPDSTASGKSAKEIVQQYYGADVWVTDEEQEKHPSFVLVPAFSGTVVDDNWNASEQIDVTVRLINALSEQYSVDKNRIYTTGQSMGCMTSLYLSGKYPDLFAAYLFVSGQWNISDLKGLENEKFFYITAGGDAKASGGQDEVMKMLDDDGVGYSYGTWSAQNSDDEQNAEVQKLIEEGKNANMICFETGTVFKEGQTGMEHMASFNYAYKLSAVRDWLYNQSK